MFFGGLFLFSDHFVDCLLDNRKEVIYAHFGVNYFGVNRLSNSVTEINKFTLLHPQAHHTNNENIIICEFLYFFISLLYL